EITVTPEEKEEKTKRPYLQIAAAAAFLIATGFIADWKYGDEMETKNSLTDNKAEEFVIQEASFDLGVMPALTLELETEEIAPAGKYHIIAGAFRYEENAEKKMALLKEASYKPSRLGQNKYGLHQVAYFSTNDAQEALQKLREIRANDNEGAWLLVKNMK
ncbi:MAG: SPOR domain-containing protein, partial [Flavobacteriaceae bacterium]|nr:SPOR domain-containing protein [Flavobacteriaceae bacterium]